NSRHIPLKDLNNQNTSFASPKKVSSVSTLAWQKPLRVDYKNSGTDQGAVILKLSRHSPAQVKQSNDRLQLTLRNYPLLNSAQNTYDLSAYNSLVRRVEVDKLGNDAVVSIYNNGGNWDYKLHDTGAQIVVDLHGKGDILGKGQDLSAERPKFFARQKGGRVSFDFQDVDVRTVLQILAKEAGINIVASDSVKGKLSLKLKNVRWEEALNLILEAKDLGMTRIGSIVNIAPKTELNKRDKEQLTLQKEQLEMGGLQSRTFRLKYKDAEGVKKMLEKTGSNSEETILSKRGSVVADSSTGTLIVTDIPANLDKFSRMLQQIDIPSDQVMVSARIVEVRDSYARNLGLSLRTSVQNGRFTYGGALVGQGEGATAGLLPANINFPLSMGAGYSGLSLGYTKDSAVVSLAIAAMQEEGQAKIISSPNVLMLNGEKASLEDGVDVPYRVKQGEDEGYATQFKRAVTGLTVTPHITPDGQVILEVEVDKDTPNPQDGSISVKKLTTKAMIEDGGTLVLGGIYDENNSESVRKVPLLGDIPLLGNLFKTKDKSSERRQVLIFLTPQIVRSSLGKLEY
ncbi:MAG: type IV pilus secretin PilQ, partial [Neisseriaceae bacterium]